MDYYKDFDNCQSAMIDSIKLILYERHNDIFDKLDFDDDGIFLEPLIYSYIHQDDDKWLDSIIFGYQKSQTHKIDVFSNSEGTIYVPATGYFKTTRPDAGFNLSKVNGIFFLTFEDNKAEFQFEHLSYTDGGVEILKHLHPMLEKFFKKPGKETEQNLLIQDVFIPHVKSINAGFDILKKANLDHYLTLNKCLKKIVLYQAEFPNCFAVFAAHNMIFFNTSNWNNELFFADHLAHEGAHVTFNTLTYESKSDLFKYPYYEAFSKVSGRASEHSTLYLRFHGLFTFGEILKTLGNCLSDPDLSVDRIKEVKGRIAFQLRRFKTSLNSFEDLDIFEEAGLSWYNFFHSQYLKYSTYYGHLISDLDLSDQSYDFNSEVFLMLNKNV